MLLRLPSRAANYGSFTRRLAITASSTPTTTPFPSDPSGSNSSTSSNPTHHLITLIRSSLSVPSYSSRTLESLGLHNRYQSVLHPFSSSVTGQILRVKELVEVRNVNYEEGSRWIRMRKSQGSGVEVRGRVYGGGKGLEREE